MSRRKFSPAGAGCHHAPVNPRRIRHMEALLMKPPFKLGWADYALIVLTCLLILLFFERWTQPVNDWLREMTAPQNPIPGGAR